MITYKEYKTLNGLAGEEMDLPAAKEALKTFRKLKNFWFNVRGNHKTQGIIKWAVSSLSESERLTKKELFAYKFTYPALVRYYERLNKELEWKTC